MDSPSTKSISRMYMRKTKITLWLPKAIIEDMIKYANQTFPSETGGCLMGYFSKNKKDIVVSSLVGPGPNSKNNKTSFIPDYGFQEREIKKLYAKLKRCHTYLGDWHSHPNGSLSLSPTDKTALNNIARYPKARVPQPIMMLLADNPDNWKVKSWQQQTKKIMRVKIKTQIVELSLVKT